LVSICSNSSNRELILRDKYGEYMQVVLAGEVSASTTVWLYTKENSLSNFFETLSSYDKPWKGTRTWTSIENDLSISVSSSSLGAVLFEITLCSLQGEEEWQINISINSEFGQLSHIAKDVKDFLQQENQHS